MTFKQILEQTEWVGAEGGSFPRNLQPISYAGSVLLDGQTLYARGTPVATTAASGLYKDETFIVPGCLYGDGPVVFPKAGCRPRSAALRWQSAAPGFHYINRFSDGEVWVSANQNSRTGTKISHSLIGGNWPRGVRYLIVHLWGGGGGGACGGLLASTYGGGSGAVAAILIRLPENGCVSLHVGDGGAGSATASTGASNTGKLGGPTEVVIDDNYIVCGGGAGGRYYYNDMLPAAIVHSSMTGSDIAVLASASGANPESGVYPAGRAAQTITYTDPTPEGGVFSRSGAAGGKGGNAGYGNGSDGGDGGIAIYY